MKSVTISEQEDGTYMVTMAGEDVSTPGFEQSAFDAEPGSTRTQDIPESVDMPEGEGADSPMGFGEGSEQYETIDEALDAAKDMLLTADDNLDGSAWGIDGGKYPSGRKPMMEGEADFISGFNNANGSQGV